MGEETSARCQRFRTGRRRRRRAVGVPPGCRFDRQPLQITLNQPIPANPRWLSGGVIGSCRAQAIRAHPPRERSHGPSGVEEDETPRLLPDPVYITSVEPRASSAKPHSDGLRCEGRPSPASRSKAPTGCNGGDLRRARSAVCDGLRALIGDRTRRGGHKGGARDDEAEREHPCGDRERA